MKIEIDLAETGTLHYTDNDGEMGPTGTIQEAIIAEAARQLREWLQEELRPRMAEIRREVSNARFEALESVLSQEVIEAMDEPIRKTNHYGDPTGEITTLKEMVVEEVKRYLEEKTGDGFSSRKYMTRAEKYVQEEVDKVIKRELRVAMDKAQEAAVAVVEETATEVVTAAMRKKLGV